MMEGQHADAGTQPDGRGLGGDMCQDGHQRRKDAIAAGMVLRDPDCIEPECLGIADLLEGLVIDASLVGGVVLSPGGEDKEGEFHDACLLLVEGLGRVRQDAR